jgi:hypothetical protein
MFGVSITDRIAGFRRASPRAEKMKMQRRDPIAWLSKISTALLAKFISTQPDIAQHKDFKFSNKKVGINQLAKCTNVMCFRS